MTTDITIFDTLVGIDGLTYVLPDVAPSDTVNTLNGITENAVIFLTLENGGTKAAMFAKIKSQAFEFLESELIGGLATYKDFRSVIDETAKTGISTGDDVYISDGLSYLGTTVRINRTPDKTKVVIKGIDFVSDTTFNSMLKVFNLRTGLEEDSRDITVIQGVNEFIINKDLESKFGGGLYYIGFVPISGSTFTGLTQESNGKCIEQKTGTLAVGATVGVNNVVEVEPFINALISIEYSYTAIITEYKELLATAFKYACAAVMLDRVCVSKQADRETLINREANEALAQMYREDAIKYIKNARNEIYAKMNQTGNLKTIEKKVQVNSLGSFV